MGMGDELRHHRHIPETAMEEYDCRAGGGGWCFGKEHMRDQVESIVVYVNVSRCGFQEFLIPGFTDWSDLLYFLTHAGWGVSGRSAKRVDLFVVISRGLSNRFVYERFNSRFYFHFSGHFDGG